MLWRTVTVCRLVQDRCKLQMRLSLLPRTSVGRGVVRNQIDVIQVPGHAPGEFVRALVRVIDPSSITYSKNLCGRRLD